MVLWLECRRAQSEERLFCNSFRWITLQLTARSWICKLIPEWLNIRPANCITYELGSEHLVSGGRLPFSFMLILMSRRMLKLELNKGEQTKIGNKQTVMIVDWGKWWNLLFNSRFIFCSELSKRKKLHFKVVFLVSFLWFWSVSLYNLSYPALTLTEANCTFSVNCSIFGRKKKQTRDKYVAKHNSVYDQLDLMTYEEVVKISSKCFVCREPNRDN